MWGSEEEGSVLLWRGRGFREVLGGRDKVSAQQRRQESVDCADSPGRGIGMNKGTGVVLDALYACGSCTQGKGWGCRELLEQWAGEIARVR